MVVTSYLSTSVNVVFTHTDFHLSLPSSIMHPDLMMIMVVNYYLMDGDNVDGVADGVDGWW